MNIQEVIEISEIKKRLDEELDTWFKENIANLKAGENLEYDAFEAGFKAGLKAYEELVLCR